MTNILSLFAYFVFTTILQNASKIINYYKWETLINFFREKERKKMSEGKKKRKKSLFACPPLC